MDIPKTDIHKILFFLEQAADLYDAIPNLRAANRARLIRQLTSKIRSRSKQQ